MKKLYSLDMILYEYMCIVFLQAIVTECVQVAGDLTIKAVIYEIKKHETWYPYDVVPKNGEYYLDIIEKANQDIVIFPEYGLTTMETVQKPPHHLGDYSIVLPETIGTNICHQEIDEENNINQDVLKNISCTASNYQKHVVFHVLEKNNESFYSTIVHIDKNGAIQNLYRKEIIYHEKSIKPFKDNQTNLFNIDGTKFEIIMGYDFLKNWKTYDKNIIYFSPLNFQMPLFYDSTLLYSLSKQYHLNIYSPAVIGCNDKYNKYCTRSKSIFIENGIDSGKCNCPSSDKTNFFTKTDNNLICTIKSIEDNKLETEFCIMEIVSKNEEAQQQYGFISCSGPVKFNLQNFNLTVCALVKLNISESSNRKFSIFESIYITSKSNGLSVATTLSSGLTSIDHKMEYFENGVVISGYNLKNLISFGIISEAKTIKPANSNSSAKWDFTLYICATIAIIISICIFFCIKYKNYVCGYEIVKKGEA